MNPSSYIHCAMEGNGTPLQYSCLANPMDGGAWWAAVRGVSTSRTQLSDFTFTFHFHALEKEMATHSSVLAWRIPGMGQPDGLLSMGSRRVRHDWSDLALAWWSSLSKWLDSISTYYLTTCSPLCLLNSVFQMPVWQSAEVKYIHMCVYIRYNN